jgi:zinc protease
MILFRFAKNALAVLLLFVTAGTALAQLNLTDTLPVDPKIRIGKLENGLTYYIRQNKKPEQKVELRLAINAGSILEDNDQQGLAHMAEHMAFNGTKNFKKNEIVSFLQSIGVQFGGDLNAYTGFDETVYILPIPLDKPGNLDKGFQILEDWAHQVSYMEDDINEERNVILEESRAGKGADDRMFRQLYPKLFEGSKYADRLPIGVDSIIKNFKPDAIRRFYKDWYRPNLMAVLVVGDIDPAKAEALIRKHFSGLKNPDNGRERALAPVPAYSSSDAMIVTDKEATTNSISITYSATPVKPAATLGEYKRDLVKNIFSTLTNQRLRELTQKENPPFLAAFVDFNSYARGYDQFSINVYNGTNDPQKSLATAVEEVERVKRFGFTKDELERAKKNIIANLERAYNERDKTESEAYVSEYIRNFLQQETIPGIEKELEYAKQLLPAITIEEVNAVGSKLEGNENFFVAFTGPEPAAGTTLPTKENLLATATAAANNKDIKPYEEKAIAANLLEKMPVPGKIIKETADAVLGTKTWTLSNGTTVTIKKTDFKNDQVLLGARRAGGTSNYGVKDKFNAQYATAVVGVMGVGSFSPTDLQKMLAGKVATANPVLTGTMDGFSGNSNVKDQETMFQLLYLRATAPRIDTALFRSFIQRNKQQMAFAMADPQTAFIDTLGKAIYNNNPLAPVMVPKPEYFDQVDLNRAVAIYKERFGDVSGMNFVIVGSVDEKTLRPLVEKYVASLPASGKKFNYKDNGVRTAKGKVNLNVNKGQADKSLIVSFHTGEIPYSDDLDLKADAISEILNIRIIEELREKIQGIYSGGMSGSLSKVPYPNYQFVIQLPCGPEKVDTLLYAMNTEIEHLKKNGPRAADLEKVKQQWLEQNKTAMKENGTWLSQILEMKFPGDNAERFIHADKYIKALTPAQIKAAANLLLNNKNVITGILRPATPAANAATGATKPTGKATPGNRKVDVQKMVELTATEFEVEVYDNADVDGDIVTLYFNGKEVMSKQSLTDKAATIKLQFDPNAEKNELVMFAENLGKTPPNTALAIIKTNGQKFDVRLSSDTSKSGSIQFSLKK